MDGSMFAGFRKYATKISPEEETMNSATDTTATGAPDLRKRGPLRNIDRWIQLFFGIVCMAMVANLQYGWTLFVNPMDAKYHWGRTAIQGAFSMFVITDTWLFPLGSYLAHPSGR